MGILTSMLRKVLFNPLNETNKDQDHNHNEDKPEQNASADLQHILDQFKRSADLIHHRYPREGLDVIYFSHMINEDKLQRDLLPPLLAAPAADIILNEQSQFQQVQNAKDCVTGILSGNAAIFYNNVAYLADVTLPASRSVEESESESIINGPHEAFNENALTNLSLIRKRVRSSHLKVIHLSVGEISKTDCYVLYMEDIANEDYLSELIRRIKNVEIDAIHDTNMLLQCIDDNPYSMFPQYMTTERPDTIASKLVSGKIVCLVDGSPSLLSAPSSFFEFFASADDYYQRWAIGTATLFLRFMALVITVTFTALYVSITSFHYEMIPENLILTLTTSRSRVPFPPIIEALLMETTIELLREAGARLPTKIGQTIGIVGGIVIGQAAVQAGLTSNVLIISVASSAIASFVIPSYIMSAAFRLFRFGLICLAGLWGNLGLVIGIAYMVIHLSGLTSLGSSYLTPVAPFQPYDWRDVFFRFPFRLLNRRPTQNRAQNKTRQKMKR
ncbi:spore germination protein [Paenibacillus campinasensis]|uniref:Spore germination protein n=3 Tax=Paenibacillus TaxID=44249 RepID=A0A268EUR4_9BACL|nr:spore germination protein [Paenibacillus campinasensis]